MVIGTLLQAACYNPSMAELTPQDVDHIADLARLELTPAEKDLYHQQLSAVLDYAARLQALDTTGIPPTSSVLPPRTVLRADEPGQCLTPQELEKNAPDWEAGQFRVPPVLD